MPRGVACALDRALRGSGLAEEPSPPQSWSLGSSRRGWLVASIALAAPAVWVTSRLWHREPCYYTGAMS